MTERRITPFLFEGEITVRVIDRDGALWFVATDVCRALGILNAADAVKGLDDDERDIDTTDTPGGHQEVIVISESGLFVLIFKSRKPQAVQFRKWVTAEVLPALRQHGIYVVGGGYPPTKRPYSEWSLEEIRAAVAQVDVARKTLSRGAGAWMWEYLGFPIPPRHLLPGWWQGELLG
jgi:prophage antirepressor-like protein